VSKSIKHSWQQNKRGNNPSAFLLPEKKYRKTYQGKKELLQDHVYVLPAKYYGRQYIKNVFHTVKFNNLQIFPS
jgi:hypothetical protein